MSLLGFVYLLRNPWPKLTWRQYRFVGLVCLIDVLAQSMVMYGQLKVGGGLYVLLYSSSMVWTAVLSHFALGKELHYQQWIAVAEVTLGLVMSNLHLFLFAETTSRDPSASWDPLFGSFVLLGGSMCAACYFICCEYLLSGGGSRSAKPIPHMALAGMTGVSTFVIVLAYNIYLSFTHGIQALYIDPVTQAAGSWKNISLFAPMLVLDNAFHAAAYFFMLHSIGAVSAGIMKGVRAVAVFVLSATIFCSIDSNQCIVLTENGHLGTGVLKCFAMYMVIRGVFAYSVAPRISPAPPVLSEDSLSESFCSEFSYGAF
eukprot:EG_transcript_14808